MLKKQPLRLAENRVWRMYTGGRLLDRFLGKPGPADGHFPEDWIGSTVLARNLGHDRQGTEGLSYIITPGGERSSLKRLLEQAPAALLGEEHYRKYGPNPGILIKLLDAAMRLPIQVHPDKGLAQKFFNSPFGKTEAWLVLATREINSSPPYILFGFREGVSWEHFVAAVRGNNSPALEQCLHRLPVQAGDVYLIEAGVPHAIGPGNLILEIQEPTDITIRAEKNVGEIVMTDEVAYQGLTLEQSLECYRFEPLTVDETLRKYKLKPRLIKERPGQGREQWLISYTDTPCFALRYLEVESYWEVEGHSTFHYMIVIKGKGRLVAEKATADASTIIIQRGDYFFIPALVSYRIENLREESVEIITCWPPQS
ncbi:type I phosphomannose isomerase catalytic subunit [Neomoorella humiferrea]|uniref:Putative mannose-6-phosphate isomerase GmuF n=1 Tax=Neomoorella humiferrea TaxID=676965 RepID=A0A2T0AJR5_9FIRM|nr:type I phosphomannose isomerase catalytic subunit [Moorella humiferrea]PRR68593.1 putative mannose-6-phosphate isomerase GmuF [Moorella humiferrea]